MKVSIVSIAKSKKELDSLKKDLKKQTFRNFEFVYSLKKGIPQAWNDAISKAKGDIIITIDSDVKILTKYWLRDMVKAIKKYNKKDPKKRTIIKGIEISPHLSWTWCNMCFYSNILKENKINENFPVAEDTEFFTRLRKKGYKVKELPISPVLHFRRQEFSKILKRSYLYGILNTKIYLKYGFIGFKASKKKPSNILKREITVILSRILFLFGMLIGFISYHFKKDNKMDWRTEQKQTYDEIVSKSKSGFQVIFSEDSIKLLDKILPKGKILDLGGGTGHYAYILNKNTGREWYCVDISSESVKIARKHYKEAKVGDVTKHIPYPKNSFKNILALSLFHHIYKEYPKAIKEIYRVLKPGGKVIIIDHDARSIHMRNLVSGPFRLTPTDEKALNPFDVIKELKANGFKIKTFKEIKIHADQQALKPHILIRMIKVPFLLIFKALDKHKGDYLIIAEKKKKKSK